MATGAGAVPSRPFVRVALRLNGQISAGKVHFDSVDSVGEFARHALLKIAQRDVAMSNLGLRRMPHVAGKLPTPAEFDAAEAEVLSNAADLPDDDYVKPGTWFRLDVIDASVPQTGESNPHARDAGARAWRETETPLRFRAPPLFVVVAARLVAHPSPLASCRTRPSRLYRYQRLF